MTLTLKHLLMLVLTAAVGLLASWTVAAFYRPEATVMLPIVALLAAVAAQITITCFIKTSDEKYLAYLRELRSLAAQDNIKEYKILGVKIREEIKAGNLESASELRNMRDKLK